MTENKYVGLMHTQQARCRRQAIDWPANSVTREGWEREAADWQAAAEAFEALVKACQVNKLLLRTLVRTANPQIFSRRIVRQIAANEAALGKVVGDGQS